MSDIFREVDEALQKEKAEKLWKEYGPILLLAAVTLVLSTAAITAYRSWDSWRNQQETQKLVEALSSENMEQALRSVSDDTRDTQASIALMVAAASHSEKGEVDQAIPLYKKVMDDKGAPNAFRDLASILYTRATLIQDPSKAGNQDLLDTLLPIAKNDRAAFQLQAKLDAALLYGQGQQKYDEAIKLLDGIEDENMTDSLKEKATALKHVYEYERSQSNKAKETPAS